MTAVEGLPEFFLGSHCLAEAAKLTTGEEEVDAPVTFPLDRGSVLVRFLMTSCT